MSDNKPVSGDCPAIVYDGTTLNPNEYAEDREITGRFFRSQNAKYADGSWTQQGSDTPFAVIQNSDGSISFGTQPPLTDSWIVWAGSGQRGVYNVKDFQAAGNGTTDDTLAIQNAATAANTAGGGIVYCPPGKYSISAAIKLGSYTTLLGAGPENTIIAAQGNMNGGPQYDSGSMGYVQNIDMVVNVGYDSDDPTNYYDIYVMNITLYGDGRDNYGVGFPHQPVTPQGALLHFRHVVGQGAYRCNIQSSSNHGIFFYGSDIAGEDYTGDFYIVNCTIDLFSDFNPPFTTQDSGFPIRTNGLDRGFVSRNKIGFNNQSPDQYKTNDGMDFPASSGLVITDNEITGATDGIGVNDGSDIVIARNIIVDCKGYGISSFASLGSGASQMVIESNTVLNSGSACIWVAPITGSTNTRSDTIIANNSVARSGGEAIIVGASGTICHDNTIDLQGADNTGIHCSATEIALDGNKVINAGTGSTGIHLDAGATVMLNNNDLSATSTAVSCADYGGDLSMLTNCIMRNNAGLNPVGAIDALATSLTEPVTNTTPFDCVAYVGGGSGFTILIDEVDTELGSGVAFNVPAGTVIESSGGGSPSVVWFAT